MDHLGDPPNAPWGVGLKDRSCWVDHHGDPLNAPWSVAMKGLMDNGIGVMAIQTLIYNTNNFITSFH